MAVNKKRDFKRLSLCIQDFLKRLPCSENTGFLRDTLYLSLLELHKLYVKGKERPNQTGEQALVCSLKDVDKFHATWPVCKTGKRFVEATERKLEKKNIISDDCDSLGRTYLMYGIHQDNTETIHHILSLNFNVNAQAHDGSTALHVACQHQKMSVAALLLKNKASVSIQDKKGRSVLHWAAASQSTDMLKLLLQYGADINVQDCDGMTPAMWACHLSRSSNLAVLRNALERVDPRTEAILDEQDNSGRTALHWAAMTPDQNNLLCLKELLAVADASKIRDNQGRTPLHSAAAQGFVLACQQIISSCGKDIMNVPDNENQTALHLATLCGHGETIDFLLQHGANASLKNKNERTALQEAEIGHYHYCLLVFASFEHMKDKKEIKSMPKSKDDLVKPEDDLVKKNKRNQKYESWVIPSTSLNESHDIPTHTGPVDVTEIKGFEINSGEDTSHVIVPDKKSTDNVTISDTTNDKKPAITNNTSATTREAVTGSVTPRIGNKTALLQRSEAVEDCKEKKDIPKMKTLPLNKDIPGKKEGHSNRDLSVSCSSDDNDDDDYSISENIEISSLVSDDSGAHNKADEDNKNDKPQKKQSTKMNDRANSLTAPIRPQASLATKLDPILHPRPQLVQNVPSHGIVAPLQPPMPEQQPGLRSKHPRRHPEHGPLAQTRTKEMLKGVFKEKKTSEQKTPEISRRSVHTGKLSRPIVRH